MKRGSPDESVARLAVLTADETMKGATSSWRPGRGETGAVYCRLQQAGVVDGTEMG